MRCRTWSWLCWISLCSHELAPQVFGIPLLSGMSTSPHSLVYCRNLLRVHLIPLSWMKTLNSADILWTPEGYNLPPISIRSKLEIYFVKNVQKSQKARIGRDLWRISGPTTLIKGGCLNLALQEHFPTLFKYLDGRRIHNPGNLC